MTDVTYQRNIGTKHKHTHTQENTQNEAQEIKWYNNFHSPRAVTYH